jgi:signal transduction histidine kinase
LKDLNIKLTDTKYELGHALESGAQQGRKNVTKELHSDVQHFLSMSRVLIQPIADTGNQNAQKAFDAVSQGLDAVRRIINNLDPPEFENPKATFLEWVEALAKRNSLQVPIMIEDNTNGSINQLDRQNGRLAYEIVQNALVNVCKHAQATQAKVSISSKGESFAIVVSDDGKGLPPGWSEHSDRWKSHGVSGMKAQTELLRGTIDWVPSAGFGKGTDVVLTIPRQDRTSDTHGS